MCDELCVAACDQNVVYVDEQVNIVRALVEREQRCVSERVVEAYFQQISAELGIPGSGCLFKTVDCFAYATNIIWFVSINEAWRLVHIHFLRKGTL